MKRTWWLRLAPAMLLAAMITGGGMTALCADTPEHGQPGDRLDQLEKRVNDLAEQQQDFMKHSWAAVHRLEGPARPEAGLERPPLLPPHPAMHFPPPADPRCPIGAKCGRCHVFLVALLALASAINILIAVWIYTDIRKRGEGPGIFIALALIAGIPTAIIYALVRIADRKT